MLGSRDGDPKIQKSNQIRAPKSLESIVAQSPLHPGCHDPSMANKSSYFWLEVLKHLASITFHASLKSSFWQLPQWIWIGWDFVQFSNGSAQMKRTKVIILSSWFSVWLALDFRIEFALERRTPRSHKLFKRTILPDDLPGACLFPTWFWTHILYSVPLLIGISPSKPTYAGSSGRLIAKMCFKRSTGASIWVHRVGLWTVRWVCCLNFFFDSFRWTFC